MKEITITIKREEIKDLKWALDLATMKAKGVAEEEALAGLLEKIIEAEGE